MKDRGDDPRCQVELAAKQRIRMLLFRGRLTVNPEGRLPVGRMVLRTERNPVRDRSLHHGRYDGLFAGAGDGRPAGRRGGLGVDGGNGDKAAGEYGDNPAFVHGMILIGLGWR